MDRRSTGAYALLVAVAFTDQLGYGVLAPVLPTVAAATGRDGLAIGVLVASFAVGLLVGMVPATVALRRWPARTVLTASLVLSAAAHAGFAAVTGYLPWLLARAAAGVAAAGMWLAVLTTIRRRWPDRAAVLVGGLLGAYGAGAIVGPLLGGLGGTVRPFLVLAGLTAVLALLSPAVGGGAPVREPLPLRRVAAEPRVLAATVTNAMVGLALATLEGVYPLLFGRHLDAGRIGLLFLAATVPLAIAAPVAGWVHDRARAPRHLAWALVVLGLATAAVPLTGRVALWAPVLVVIGAAAGASETWSGALLLDVAGGGAGFAASVVWTLGFVAGYALGPVVAAAIGRIGGPLTAGLAVLTGCVATAAWVHPTRLRPSGALT